MKTVGLIGFGAIGRYITRNWSSIGKDYKLSRVLAREGQVQGIRETCGMDTPVTADPSSFLADVPDIVIEAAGHDAVRQFGPAILEAGRDLYLLSIGVLADDVTTARLDHACRAGGGRIFMPAGALAGFDGLMALCSSGLRRVRYTSRKPAFAWCDTPGADRFDLASMQSPVTIFEGSAREAAHLYPKNANLAAAVAVAGLGLDATDITLIADPHISENVGEVEAEGDLGSLFIRVSGEADPSNPKTSASVGASVISALANQSARFCFI